MKKIYPFALILFVPAVLLLMSNSTGSIGGKSGSPGDGFNNCTDCHIGNPVINQTGWITTDIPVGGYMAGEEYTITLTGTHENVQKFGFELTAEDLFAEKTGTFTVNSTRTQLTNMGDAVTHTAEGNVPSGDSNTWDMNWTAPEEGTGDVTFYAALNAANGNGTTSGDQIYLTSLLVTEFNVGLDDVSMTNRTSVFPNPASDFLNVNATVGSEIQIIDMSGRQVVNFRMLRDQSSMDVSHLENGLYLIRITDGENISSSKLIIR